MTYRYRQLQELVDDPAGFPPAGETMGTLEEMRAFADPLYAIRSLAEGVRVVWRLRRPTAIPCGPAGTGRRGRTRAQQLHKVHGGGMILMGIEMDADISRYVALSGVPFCPSATAWRSSIRAPRGCPRRGSSAHRPCGRAGHRSAPRCHHGRQRRRGHWGRGRYPRGSMANEILVYPMLEADRTVACDDELDGLAHVWFAENNKMAWEAVLGERREPMKCCPARPRRATRASRAWRRLPGGGRARPVPRRNHRVREAPDGGSRSRRAPCAHGPHAHLRHVPAAHCRQGPQVRYYVISQL